MPFGLWTQVGWWKHVFHGCKLAQPGKYHWTIYVWQWCSLMSNYFDHLLLGRITVLRTWMWPTVTDRVAWSVGRSVCLSVTLVSPAKTAPTIDMPFGFRTRVGPRKEPCTTPYFFHQIKLPNSLPPSAKAGGTEDPKVGLVVWHFEIFHFFWWPLCRCELRQWSRYPLILYGRRSPSGCRLKFAAIPYLFVPSGPPPPGPKKFSPNFPKFLGVRVEISIALYRDSKGRIW